MNGAANPAENSYVVGLSISSGGALTFSGGSITANGASGHRRQRVGRRHSHAAGGTTILTTGLGAAGIVNSTGSTVVATGLTVMTTGEPDPTDNNAAAGFYNSGTLNLTNSTVTTSGENANGVVTFGGGTTTINGGSITTSGSNAIGLEFERHRFERDDHKSGGDRSDHDLDQRSQRGWRSGGRRRPGHAERRLGDNDRRRFARSLRKRNRRIGCAVADHRDQCRHFGGHLAPSATRFSFTRAVRSR